MLAYSNLASTSGAPLQMGITNVMQPEMIDILGLHKCMSVNWKHRSHFHESHSLFEVRYACGPCMC